MPMRPYVHIDIHKTDNRIHLVYSDNGVGFDNTLDYSGLGLNSIKGRVEAIGWDKYIQRPLLMKVLPI